MEKKDTPLPPVAETGGKTAFDAQEALPPSVSAAQVQEKNRKYWEQQGGAQFKNGDQFGK